MAAGPDTPYDTGAKALTTARMGAARMGCTRMGYQPLYTRNEYDGYQEPDPPDATWAEVATAEGGDD